MRSTQRNAPFLLILLAAALSIGGCGGGSSTAAPSASDTGAVAAAAPSSPEKARFVAAADSICKGLNAELAANAAKNTSVTEIARVVPDHVKLERDALSKLGKLDPPSSLTDDWRRILGYRRTLANELAEIARVAGQHQDAQALKVLVASKKRMHKALQDAAKPLGFKDCADVG
jgi:hypothetical protein